MRIDRTPPDSTRGIRLSIGLARCAEDIVAAQRLRWQVFAEEQGADLDSEIPGLDVDRLDAHCDHLVVKQPATGQVIGTYRLLSAENAQRHGSYYSESEFEMGSLLSSGRRLLEIGRSCVHPDHRNGGTIALLWSGIASYLMQSKHDAVIGCASVPLGHDIAQASALAHRLAEENHSTPALTVTPRNPLPIPPATAVPALQIPPLIKGYLRSGAVICGAPCWDEGFNTADLFMYLPIDRIELRYARHFLGSATTVN